jgi:hypothetical protein
MTSLIIKNGKFTFVAEFCLIIIFLLGSFGIPLLNMPIWLAIPVGGLAIISAALLIFEGAAVSVGLKPFTNDPLGWRKAKETYKKDGASDEVAKKDDQA